MRTITLDQAKYLYERWNGSDESYFDIYDNLALESVYEFLLWCVPDNTWANKLDRLFCRTVLWYWINIRGFDPKLSLTENTENMG